VSLRKEGLGTKKDLSLHLIYIGGRDQRGLHLLLHEDNTAPTEWLAKRRKKTLSRKKGRRVGQRSGSGTGGREKGSAPLCSSAGSASVEEKSFFPLRGKSEISRPRAGGSMRRERVKRV